MARTERAYTTSFEPQSQAGARREFVPAYPKKPQTDENGRIRRTRERPQPNTETRKEAAAQVLTIRELRQLIGAAIFVAVLLIVILLLNAYAANVQHSINALTRDNLRLEDEIDALNMKIDQSSSIEMIESYAMDELNMRYPKSSQCIYIDENMELMDNFSQIIRQKAYE